MACRIRIEPLGREVPANDKTSILDSCLRHGVWLPHACTHGTCGTCKARVLEGEVDLGDASTFALMDFERDDGYALLCQARPLTDVTVEADVDIEEGVEFPLVEDFSATVKSVDVVSPSVRMLKIALDRGAAILPGQYFLVDVPGAKTQRAYSVAAIDPDRQSLEFHVKFSPGGVASEWVFTRLQAGDVIHLSGPYGRFFLRPADEVPLLFLAGGTGWAPLKAMVSYLFTKYPDYPATVIFGARTRKELYDHEFLTKFSQRYPSLQYIPAVSDEAVDPEGPCATGRVDEVIGRRFERLQGYKAYVAGPPPMVDACVTALYQRRLFARDIYREDFFTQAEHGQSVRSPLDRRSS